METTKDELARQEVFSIQPTIDKYRAAVETVAGYMSRAVDLLEQLFAEQDEMIDRLKGVLSMSKSLRRADFDVIFANVLAHRRRTRETLPALVKGYRGNREAVVEQVQDLFSSNVTVPPGDKRVRESLAKTWPALKERLLNSQETGEREVVAVLRQVHTEQEELSAALSGLLSRGEKLKISDLKTVARKLAGRDSRESAELAALLATSEASARNAEMQWQRLAG